MKTQSNGRLIRPILPDTDLGGGDDGPGDTRPAQTAPAHVLPDGEVPPGLQAARAHMLEQPENMLVFRNMDQLFETRVVARSGPVRALPRPIRRCLISTSRAPTLPKTNGKTPLLPTPYWSSAMGGSSTKAIVTTAPRPRISSRFPWPSRSPRCWWASRSTRV